MAMRSVVRTALLPWRVTPWDRSQSGWMMFLQTSLESAHATSRIPFMLAFPGDITFSAVMLYVRGASSAVTLYVRGASSAVTLYVRGASSAVVLYVRVKLGDARERRLQSCGAVHLRWWQGACSRSALVRRVSQPAQE
jgi:hypothetical protein